MNKDLEVLEILDKLEECAYAMKDLPMSNWIDLANSEVELDLKIMDWVETIKLELLKGKQALLELKAIKDANPSEALECLKIPLHNEWLRFYPQFKEMDETTKIVDGCRMVKSDADNYLTIKQALLKAQEQEKILSIILKKRIDLESFYSTFVKDNLDYKYYEKYYGTYGLEKLTQEEFELLKKVFYEMV